MISPTEKKQRNVVVPARTVIKYILPPLMHHYKDRMVDFILGLDKRYGYVRIGYSKSSYGHIFHCCIAGAVAANFKEFSLSLPISMELPGIRNSVYFGFDGPQALLKMLNRLVLISYRQSKGRERMREADLQFASYGYSWPYKVYETEEC